MSKLIAIDKDTEVYKLFNVAPPDVMCGDYMARVFDHQGCRHFRLCGPLKSCGADHSGDWLLDKGECEDMAQILEYIAKQLRRPWEGHDSD